MMSPDEVRRVVEAALLTADEPLSVNRLVSLFAEDELPAENRGLVREALAAIRQDSSEHVFEVAQVASGYRLQVKQEFAPWVSRLFAERPPRYSRALLETLALIVYWQPVTRGDIEAVRGVTVSPSIMRTLLDRGWIRAVGQRETPGRPTMYGTTRAFLDYFNLKSLDELPPFEEVRSPLASELGSEVSEPNKDEKPMAEVVQLPIADR